MMQEEIKQTLFGDKLEEREVKRLSDEFISEALEIGASIYEDELDLDPIDSNLTMDEKHLLVNNLICLQNEHLIRVGATLLSSDKTNSFASIINDGLIFLN